LATILSGQRISGPSAAFYTFLAVFLFGVYYVRRRLLKNRQVANMNKVT